MGCFGMLLVYVVYVVDINNPRRARMLIGAKVVDIVVRTISSAARCVVASGMLLNKVV